MPSIALGDEFLVDDPVSLLSKPTPVRRGIVVTPPHRAAGTEPIGRASLEPGTAEDHEEPTARSEPSGDSSEHGAMLFPGDMEQRVERDHRGETARREIYVHEVRPEEPSLRHQPTRPADLDIGDVDARYPKPIREQFRCRDPGSASEVEHPCAAGKGSPEGPEPRSILVLPMTEDVGGIAPRPVPIGGAVPALPHGPGPSGPRWRPRPKSPRRHERPTPRS